MTHALSSVRNTVKPRHAVASSSQRGDAEATKYTIKTKAVSQDTVFFCGVRLVYVIMKILDLWAVYSLAFVHVSSTNSLQLKTHGTL